MRKPLVAIMVVSLGVAAFAYRTASTNEAESPAPNKKRELVWLTFDEGVGKALSEDKLLVVDFYTDWCHWCKVMEKETYASKEVLDYANNRVIFAQVNAETSETFPFRGADYSGRELTMMFGINGFPATVFMSRKGEFLTLAHGYIEKEKFANMLRFFAEDWYEKMDFQAFEKKELQKTKD